MKNILLLLTIGLAMIGVVGCGGSDTPPAAPTPSGPPPGMPVVPGPSDTTAAAPAAKPDEAAKTEAVDNSDNPWADDVKTSTVGAIGNAFLGLAPKVNLPGRPGAMPGGMPGAMPGGPGAMPGGAPGPAKQ